MAPAVNLVGAGFSGGGSGLNSSRLGGAGSQWRQRRAVVVRTEAINSEIRKAEEKVSELPKPLTAYRRDGWVRAILLAEYSTKLVKGDSEITCNFSWKQTAIYALQSVLQEDFKATEIEVGVVRKENLVFRVLSTEEIDEHLVAISKQD